MADPVCLNGGYIAGAEIPCPDDFRIYYNQPKPLIACNRLYCGRCKSWVRNFSGYRRSLTMVVKAAELYDEQQPSKSPYLSKETSGELFRVYVCRCQSDETSGWNEVDGRDTDWTCGGHPL